MFLEKEIIQRSGEPCQNGYVYTEEVLRAIADQINSKPTFGTLGKNDRIGIDVSEISHSVSNASVENGNLVADVRVLDTVKGSLLRRVLKVHEVDWAITMLVGGSDEPCSRSLLLTKIDAVPPRR